MLERIRSVELAAHVGRRVRVVGWLQAVRSIGAINFVVVRDGWGVVQGLVAAPPDLELESIVTVEGSVVVEPQLELHGCTVTPLVIAEASPVVLLSKKVLNVPLPTLLEHATVANRHPSRRRIFRIAAAAMRGFRAGLDREGFVEIQSPKLVGTATEGGANVFAVSYGGRTAYLAQSPQLYKQVMVGVFERVYEVGPVFRAEPHETSRHLAQYTSLDVELGFITDHRDVMAQLSRVLVAMFAEVAPLADVPAVPAEIPVIDFLEARELVSNALGEAHRHEPDLAPEGERWLGAWAKREHGSDFVFVTGYPLAKRPFYTFPAPAPDPARPAQSNSFDLLFRGTELVTGGQRLHLYADYVAALAQRGMSTEPIAHYLEAFRTAMPPHGGFAIGLERFVMQLLDLPNIRLATLFPRDLNRLVP